MADGYRLGINGGAKNFEGRILTGRQEQAPFKGQEGSQEEDSGSLHPQGLVPSQGMRIDRNQNKLQQLTIPTGTFFLPNPRVRYHLYR
jgi:hypothetical protein